ncbi:MAG: tRNA1(Val) (adenine(37)-N6)-methyltransferase [Phocaeicola sp.]
MPNPFFQFKQFAVQQERCAMKVGTDGVLLGAWADVSHSLSALDIGTGTGLIALMLAQRNALLQVSAIDIDAGAAEQALENVARSPWSNRIKVEQADVLFFGPDSGSSFDLIVCNPPYFSDSLKSPCESRTTARHNDSLRFEQLVERVSFLLAENGRFCVVIPTDAMDCFVNYSEQVGLFLTKRLRICTKPDVAPKRVLLEFQKQSDSVVEENVLVVELSRHQYSAEYTELTREFYLKM